MTWRKGRGVIYVGRCHVRVLCLCTRVNLKITLGITEKKTHNKKKTCSDKKKWKKKRR